MIDVERHGPVAVLRMDHGKVNAMDLELLAAIPERLAALEEDGVAAAVLTGNEKVFSAGLDLRRYVDGGPDYAAAVVPALSEAFLAVVTAPFPVVAAVNGAAIAGGAILAAACDRTLLAAGARIGASELLVGVPFPVAAIEILSRTCGPRLAEVVWSGALFSGEDAVRVGLADRVVDPAELAGDALQVAQALAAMSPATTRLTKAYLWSATLDLIAERRAVDDDVTAQWVAPDTVARVAAYLDSTLRRA